jgi:diguanylate cyclase (GGDEF)-like protein
LGPVKRRKPHDHRVRGPLGRLPGAGFYGFQTIPRRDFAHYSEKGWAAPNCGQRGSDVYAFWLVEANLVTTVLAIVVAALATLVVVLLAVLVTRRRLALALARMNERIEEMAGELTGAVERAEEEGRRGRVLGELGASIDLDEVLSRTLEAAGAVPGADAALVSMQGPDGKPLVVTLGLSAEEAEQQAVAGPSDGRQARSISVAYRYDEERASNGDRIHSGLAVPLAGESGRFGYLTVFSRSDDGSLDERVLAELEALAERAGPALDNAKRYGEARQLADLDALTGLHNRRYFHETLAREVARAQRYDRNLALIVFDLDDFKAVNDRVGHLAGDSVLADAAERVRDVVRSADVACRVGGDEFAVILPESTLADADQLYRRIQAAVSLRPLALVGKLRLSAGMSELRSEDDATSLFERTDEALYRAKNAGKDQIVAAV